MTFYDILMRLCAAIGVAMIFTWLADVIIHCYKKFKRSFLAWRENRTGEEKKS